MSNQRASRHGRDASAAIGPWATPWMPLLTLLLRAFDGVVRTGKRLTPPHDVLAAATWQIAQSMRHLTDPVVPDVEADVVLFLGTLELIADRLVAGEPIEELVRSLRTQLGDTDVDCGS